MKRTFACLIVLASCLVLSAAASDDFKRERGKPSDTLKNSFEGKAAPKLEIKEWMNADAAEMNWDKLKGKVVLIDLWAHW